MRATLVLAAALVALPARADRSTDDVVVYTALGLHALACITFVARSSGAWATTGTAPRTDAVSAMVFGSGLAALAGFFLVIDQLAVQGGRWVPAAAASFGLGLASMLQGTLVLFRAHAYETELAPVAATDGRSLTLALAGRF